MSKWYPKELFFLVGVNRVSGVRLVAYLGTPRRIRCLDETSMINYQSCPRNLGYKVVSPDARQISSPQHTSYLRF